MDAKQFQKIAKALADPRRFEILELITAAGGEICCGEVVECFPVAQATVSHHLKELTEAGLVERRAEGQFKYLRSRPDILAQYADELKRRISAPPSKAVRSKKDRRKSAGA
jgi:ArsR family transcriptional regulator